MYREFVLLTGLVLTAGALSVRAVPTSYSDQNGDTVKYTSISEQTLTAGDPDELFGLPSSSGNTLNFDPTSFTSFSSSSQFGGTEETAGQLNFNVEAFAGTVIERIELVETGETDIVDPFGNGSDGTYANVVGEVKLTVVEVDGTSLELPLILNRSMTFNPSDGDWNADSDGAVSVEWNGGIVLDIQQALVDNGVSFITGATKVSLEIVNSLSTGSESSTSAYIAKKDVYSFSITAVSHPIPDTASTGILLLLACASLLGARNKMSDREE